MSNKKHIAGTQTKYGFCSVECPDGQDKVAFVKALENVHENVVMPANKGELWRLMRDAESHGDTLTIGGRKFKTLAEYEEVYGKPHK